jgi:hypothetical protein
MEYDTLTEQLNNLISTEVSADAAWNAVPGGLDKVSTSSLGFAWGIGSGKVWICQLPCTGNWKAVDLPGSLLDITTDDSKVYVLFNDGQVKLAMKSANNIDDWIIVNGITGMTNIISTSSYVWSQIGTQKWKLPKPGTTGNWIQASDASAVTITSGSSTSLYGVDAAGNPMKSDESLQSAWSTIPEFGAKYTSIVGNADQTALYGVDPGGNVSRCINGDCSKVNTQGYVPQNLTVEPVSKQLWMTTTKPGDSGNIFSRNDSPDYSNILQSVQPVDKQRDAVVQEVNSKYNETTAATMMSKQLQMIRKILEGMFDFKPKEQNAAQQKTINGELSSIHEQIEQLKITLPIVQKVLVVVGVTAVVYLGSGFIGEWTHVVALGVFVSGLYFFAVG